MSEERSDEELMASWRSGDRQAFEHLFRRHAPRMRGYFIRTGVRPQAAGDLVQQTFLHLHRARADFRAGSRLRPWLYTIAANVRRMHFRRAGRKPEAEWNPQSHGEPSVSPQASTPEQRALRRALDQLDAAQRDVLVLHYFEDLPFAEVAEVLGISTSAAKVRAHRAYKRLRAMLDED